MKDVIDLEAIDWKLIEEKSLSNFCKKVCLAYNDTPDIDFLATVFNIHRGTVFGFLKKGTKIGWCNYDPRIGIEKSRFKLGEGLTVYLYKDGQKIDTYSSIGSCARALGITYNKAYSALQKKKEINGFFIIPTEGEEL